MEFNDIEQYSKNLFHLNANNELSDNEKPFIPNKKSLEISNSNVDICDTRVLFGNRRESMEFVRSKPLMIQNIIKALNKLTDSTEKDENIRNLLNFIVKIKNNKSVYIYKYFQLHEIQTYMVLLLFLLFLFPL